MDCIPLSADLRCVRMCVIGSALHTLKAGVSEPSAICYQYIGDQILKNMIKTTYATIAGETQLSIAELTYEETNAVRYAAEYVVK